KKRAARATLFSVLRQSVQTLDVAGQRLDVLVAQLGGDGAHDHRVAIIGAHAFAEIGQLLGNVGSVLAVQLRIGGGSVANAVRCVAAGAGGHALGQLATAPQGLATLDQCRIGGADA